MLRRSIEDLMNDYEKSYTRENKFQGDAKILGNIKEE